jgi:hypothetical protein
MILGLFAQIVNHSYHPLRSWYFAIYLAVFSMGLIYILIAWKEEKKQKRSS